MKMLEFLIVIYSLINLLYMIKQYKKFYCIYPIIAVFDFVMVTPLFLEILFGIPNIPSDVYENYVKAMRDQTTLIIYCMFVLLAQFMFSIELRRIKRKNHKLIRKNALHKKILLLNKFKYKKIIMIIAYAIVFESVLSILLSPNPLLWLSLRSVHMQIPSESSQYWANYIRPSMYLLILSIIIFKLFDFDNKWYKVVFRIILIMFFTVVNGKRTYLMIIVGLFFIIDLIRENSIIKLIPKYSIVFGLVAIYFVAYMYITDKISYNSDWYYEINEYIFRSMHVRYSIYAALHPNEIHILDYPGQSIIYSLFFFIPRSIWPTKPYPYIDYYMVGLMNLESINLVPFHMPASYYPEFVSNFGLIGLPISLVFTVLIARYFDNRKLLCKLMGAGLIALLNIYYYNDLLKIVAIFIFYLCITETKKFVFKR